MPKPSDSMILYFLITRMHKIHLRFSFSAVGLPSLTNCVCDVYAASVPDSIKAELLQRIRTFLATVDV